MKIINWGIALVAAAGCAMAAGQGEVSLSIAVAPPGLPIYAQPAMPADGYMWTPGYWSWNANDNDYFWVPGTWVAAPFVGALWTPGYWGWGGEGYAWHGGYWGEHIGYYGGINYGFGYGGVGYQGGYWNHGAFSYNRSANNVGSVRIAHVYNARINSATVNRVSYNGGSGGVRLQPTRAEASIASMPHRAQTAPQLQHEQNARSNQDLRASVNHGMPKIAATPEPGAFGASGISAARPSPAQAGARTHATIAAQQPAREQPHAAPARQAPQPRVQPEQRPAEHANPERGNAQRPVAPHEEERHEK